MTLRRESLRRLRRVLMGVAMAACAVIVAPAQTTEEVIAPVGARSLVSIAAPAGSQLTLQQGDFTGSAQILSDPRKAQYTLMIVPDRLAAPSEISVIRQGKTQEVVKVYPVVVQDEKWTPESQAALPDPTSREYTTVTQGSMPYQGFFNGIMRNNLRTMQISGVKVDITPGAKQGTYERLIPGGQAPQDLGELDIYAQQVVIGAPLRLPGTVLRIYAEEIKFVDSVNTPALIDTTPLAQPAQTAARAPGTMAEDASAVYLNIGKPIDDGGKTRFILRGSPGQKGGPPVPATPGTNLPWLERDGPGTGGQIGGIVRNWGSIPKAFHDDPLPPGWGSDYSRSIDTVWFRRYGNYEFGNGQWPGNATPGQPGGMPGVGARGAQVHSTIALSANVMDIRGGDPGPKQDDAAGAAAGQPQWSVGVSVNRGACHTQGGGHGGTPMTVCSPDTYDFYGHRSQDAATVPSPDQPVRIGATGSFARDLTGWFHPYAANARLRYAEDLYRLGRMSDAQQQLSAIVLGTTAAGGALPSQEGYLPIVQRCNVLLAKISSNVDYYGNPGGWAPLIDFPTTWQVVQADIKNIAPILIGTEQVRIQAEKAAAHLADLSQSRSSALDQIDSTKQDIEKYSDEAPKLQIQAASIAQDEAAERAAIQQREEQLKTQAEDQTRVSFLSGALKTLGAITSVLPVAQPITGAVGGALNFLSSIDERTPWQSISDLPNVAKGFSQENISKSVNSYHSFLHDVSTLDPGNPQLVFSKISGAATDIGNSFAQFEKLQDQARAPQSDMEAVLQKLEAQDTSLQSWTADVSKLDAEKEAFQQRLDSDMANIGQLTSQLTSQAAQMDTLTTAMVSAQDLVDHPAVEAAQDIARQLRDRLELDYYQFVKAYEYYVAKPFDGDSTPGLTADDFYQYLGKNNDNPQEAADALVAAYTNALHDTGSHIINDLAKDGGPSIQHATVVLKPAEIQALNTRLNSPQLADKPLLIDLEDSGLFREKDLEARLVNVESLNCDCRKVSGPPGSVRFTLDFTASNNNVVRTATQNYGYQLNAAAIPWSWSIDLSTPTVSKTESQVPPDLGQLMAQILMLPAPRPFATAPPLFPGISIDAVPLFADTSGQTKIQINSLSINLTYSYRTDSDPGARSIRVTYTGTKVAPYFYVSARDDRQLQHSFGSFSRLYHIAEPVEIVAPTQVSGTRFDGWFLRGQRVGNRNHLTIPQTSDSYFYEARYAH